MKKSLCSIFLLLLIAVAGAVVAGPTTVSATDTELTAVSDLLGTTPIWLQVETAFICAPTNGPYTCTYNSECQRYYGLDSTYVCVNPNSQRCGGHCEPC